MEQLMSETWYFIRGSEVGLRTVWVTHIHSPRLVYADDFAFRFDQLYCKKYEFELGESQIMELAALRPDLNFEVIPITITATTGA